MDNIDRFMSREKIYSVSIKQDDNGENVEAVFRYSGCECCQSGGCDVTECIGISDDKDNCHEYELCNECICTIWYGE